MKLAELAKQLNGRLIGDADLDISTLSPLNAPEKNSASFILNLKNIEKLAGNLTIPACIITIEELQNCPNQIIIRNPKDALKKAIDSLYPHDEALTLNPNHPICPTAKTQEAKLSPFVAIGPNTLIEAGAHIYPNCTIGANVKIGKNTVIYPNVTIYNNTQIGHNVTIHSGSVIGSDGFGYVVGATGLEKIQHIGYVEIGDRVEIGSNCSIDRGCLGATRIDSGTKLDNLVHIAHNVEIGHHCAITSQVGFVGSAIVKDRVQIGGQAGIMDVVVGSDVVIGGRSGVTKNLPDKAKVSGFPAQDHRKELKEQVIIKKLIQEFESKGTS